MPPPPALTPGMTFHPGASFGLPCSGAPSAVTRRDYRVSLILGDAAGHVLTHVDRDLIHGWHMRTSGWPPGEPVQDYYLLPVPPGTLPGPYRVLAAVYDAESQQRLPLDAAGRTTASIGEVRVVPPADPVVVDAPRLRLGDGASCPEPAGMLLDGDGSGPEPHLRAGRADDRGLDVAQAARCRG